MVEIGRQQNYWDGVWLTPSHKIISKEEKDLEGERSKDGNTGKKKKTTSCRPVSWSSVGLASQSTAFPAAGHDKQPIEPTAPDAGGGL